jgi:hypothetical protein
MLGLTHPIPVMVHPLQPSLPPGRILLAKVLPRVVVEIVSIQASYAARFSIFYALSQLRGRVEVGEDDARVLETL